MKLKITILFLLLVSSQVFSQKQKIEYLSNFDKAPMRWGFYLGLNKNNYKISYKAPEAFPNAYVETEPKIGFVIGLIGLLASSRLLVWAAVNIAESFGVSDLVIGLTIVALGTSLPELAASISSVLKKEYDLAVGNVIGSNMYNLLAVYSLPGLIAPGPVAESVIYRDFPVLLGMTGILFILGYGFKKTGHINRWEGGALLLAYIGYQWVIFQSAIV